MIDLDQKLPRSLSTLADARPVTTPPVAWILEAAGDEVGRPRRPRRVVVAAVAGGLTLGVSGAALAGVLPGSVTSAFHRMSDWGGPCRIDKNDAQMLASTKTPTGETLEWWRSSTATDGTVDDYNRTVAPDGRAHDMTMSCSPRQIATTKIVYAGGATSATETDLQGQAPVGTATMSVVFSDDSVTTLPLQGDRYFMGAYATPAGTAYPVTVVAHAADGSVLDSMKIDFTEH